ncbi:MAG TPA: Gfo/Idh/MocA family oxidoreductase [Flavitalea sp.]|nr:Gfo/Idh/MocA family oxidoreductase [Flavitalea sp.]
MRHLFLLIKIALATSVLAGTAGNSAFAQSSESSPLRVAVAGTSHGHVSWILNRKDKSDVQVVGIYEPNKELSARYIRQFKLNKDLFYTDLKTMLDAVKPEAVVAFGSIYEHLAAVENCAPRGIHVMVEKPLSTNVDDALKMQALAKKHGIHLLTNYETSWYATTEKTYQLLNDSNSIGKLKKAVFHHGHQGPKEIGVSKEFLQWLTDPIQNGGGALIDFGCYGANIMTYLTKGSQPVSVTAVTRQFKPNIYPKVDDEATIIVTYPEAQGIIQASWNWPFGRKDMEVYGESGYIISQNARNMLFRNKNDIPEEAIQLSATDAGVYLDPFSYFADVIRKKISVSEYGLYSLSNNIMVVKILEAARESAKTGKTVLLKK